MNKPIAGLLFFAMSLAAPHAALSQGTKITVGHATASDFLPAFVGKEKGIFAKRGLDVTLQVMANIALTPATLMSNSIQIGTTTPTTLLLAQENGIDVVVVSGGSRLQKTNPRISLVTRPGVIVNTAQDLRGKKVGVPGFNAIIDMFLKKWLLNHNVALKDVNFVESMLPNMSDMLKAGQVDAITPIEPVVSRAIAAGGIKSVDFYSEVNPDVVAAFWIADRTWADANRKTVLAFQAAYSESIAYILKNPDESRQIEQKVLGFAARSFPTFSTVVTPQDFDVVSSIGRELGVMRQQLDHNKLVWK